ncbi:uncharacterized protein HMPREF1541_10109 [Cyphellophora europaea CBS 101466]|uniref:Uncharacterized protein n=1 Tax=Cyphellophora europaea (strain CBS 101466) TaxID=1220924 RepID=W2S983_CYPE1|nr:uncharacterized protein HMPREF1541_10109 [Cyphellophora europaea CBS 101466]ETN45232.1 hypothetical protein HMPREF1541_10109 [Cyphellophora europaea CBS 101466]
MAPEPPRPSADQHSPQSPIDPISRVYTAPPSPSRVLFANLRRQQIFERTQSYYKHNSAAAHVSSGPSEPSLARSNTDNTSLRRVDSAASSKATKDKKKGVSFLSRIMGSKKRDDTVDVFDIPEISDNRSNGNDAELFSNPVGFIPRFPTPPRYIKVKAQNRRSRDFDRLFLAQILLDNEKKARLRRGSIDSKIHGIDDTPHLPPPDSRASNKAIWALEFSQDGRYMAAAGQDKKLRVWEVISAAEDREHDERDPGSAEGEGDNLRLNAPVFKQQLVREYDGHTSSLLDLSWSKNNFLLSSSMDKTVRLYHISRAECLCAFKHSDFVTSIQFHPRDDRFFLAGSLDSKIRLWSIPDKTVAYSQQVSDMVTAVAFTPDGKTSIAGCLNGMCILYDTEGLKAHSQIHVKSSRGKNSRGSKVTGIDTISIPRPNGPPDVKLLITSNDSRIRMYNLKDRTLEVKFRGHENSCSQIHASFSDDGKFVICGSEDRKVYIWPTGPVERSESDKRPVEVFEAHSSIVTSAVLASTKTRKLLAQSGDPLFDLCNPPPVTLVSRTESIVSSRAPTHASTTSDERPPASGSPRRALETPAYRARQAHPGGHIIVTADYSGQIKVFRHDCAFLKRRQESWDANSSLSKKMLARSGSVTTRNSVGSSIHRTSINLGSKNQSADRILSWRNSISGTAASASNSLSEVNLRASFTDDPPRSVSPSKKWHHRLSLRQSPRATPLTQSTSPPSPARLPQVEIQAPDSPGSFHSAKSPPRQRPEDLRPLPSNPTSRDLPHSGNDLFLMDGGQSMLAWNVEQNIVPMANRTPRTPGLLGPGSNPMSRTNSMISELSSELMSSEGSQREAVSRRPSKVDSAKSDAEDDLKCSRCGNTTFRATMGDTGHRLRCKKCGTML